MRFLLRAGLAALAAPSAYAQSAPVEPALKDVIIVTGTRRETVTETVAAPGAAPNQGADITLLAARVPGAARIANGELSGQMQYRGLFGERLNLRVNGQRFASGGPNLMDPAFHYAPAPLIASLVIDRGVSPVSKGPGLAGGADAVFKRVDFTTSGETEFHYDAVASWMSVNNGISGGGVAGAASPAWRINALGAYEEGADTEFKNGEIGGSSYRRSVFGASAGVKILGGELALDLRRQKTGPSGNPPFPMDIRFFEADFARLSYEGPVGTATLRLTLDHMAVAHAMNNFDLRPAPPPTMRREALSDAATDRAQASLEVAALGGTAKLGAEIETVRHDMNIVNPANNAYFVKPYPDIDQQRIGGFVEWRGATGLIESEIGFRIDHHEFGAGISSFGPALPAAPAMLASAFNNSERRGVETTADAVLRLWTQPINGFTWRATLARKTALPGYIQRFGWLPLNASGGLADGNTYVGDFKLKPETALIAEIGVDYASSVAYVRPTIYLRQIDNYVQGVPFDETPNVVDTAIEMVSASSGDPTPLRWANVDARLYGVDMDAGVDFAGPLRLDGVFNYVRGERRDIDDNLYRIAAPSATLGLTWEASRWSATFEARGAASQNKVSVTNGETPSDGYVVLSLYGNFKITEGVRLSAGLENIADKLYRDHLAGSNRNGFGNAVVGERVPGAGRGVFLRLSAAN